MRFRWSTFLMTFALCGGAISVSLADAKDERSSRRSDNRPQFNAGARGAPSTSSSPRSSAPAIRRSTGSPGPAANLRPPSVPSQARSSRPAPSSTPSFRDRANTGPTIRRPQTSSPAPRTVLQQSSPPRQVQRNESSRPSFGGGNSTNNVARPSFERPKLPSGPTNVAPRTVTPRPVTNRPAPTTQKPPVFQPRSNERPAFGNNDRPALGNGSRPTSGNSSRPILTNRGDNRPRDLPKVELPKTIQPRSGERPVIGNNNRPVLTNRGDTKPRELPKVELPKVTSPRSSDRPVFGNNRPELTNRGDSTPRELPKVDLLPGIRDRVDRDGPQLTRPDSVRLPGIGSPNRGDSNGPRDSFRQRIDLSKRSSDRNIEKLEVRKIEPPKLDRLPNDLRASLVERNGRGQRPQSADDLRNQLEKWGSRPEFRDAPFAGTQRFDRMAGGFQLKVARNDFSGWDRTSLHRRFAIEDQYRLHRHGDVARRLNLQVNLVNWGGWAGRPVGPIAPSYRSYHTSIWYPGPSYCPSWVWFPQWSPWVSWCAWNNPWVIYDPRPFVCRPIWVDPCPTWTYWQTPVVWQHLPVVTCGTWVDVPVQTVSNVDLQLLAVRFVDPGHPEQDLGPRYRVWFRNNGTSPVTSPFHVMLFAGGGTELSASDPNAGVTVETIAAGETVPVDIRLPLAANSLLRDAENRAMPFNWLHVLVDSHRDLSEVNLANNGAVLPRGEILPVDPAAFSVDRTAAMPGDMLTLAGEGLGPEPGHIRLVVDGIDYECEIHGWYDLGVHFRVPNAPVSFAKNAEVVVVRGDGAVSNPVPAQLAPVGSLPPAPMASVP